MSVREGARQPYEFGCKVQLTTTHRQGLVLSASALHPNQYDGHSLSESLAAATMNTGIPIQEAFVDKGYKGHGIDPKICAVYISGQKKGMTKKLHKDLKKRSAIEPNIGHMKATGKLKRNYLSGIVGDEMNSNLCAIWP